MRISRHQLFMEIAHVVAKRSTCPRLNVGSVVVWDNRVVSIGYNGAPAGKPHCTEIGCKMQHGHCVSTIHAEVNAIAHVPIEISKLPGKSIYITNAPCSKCAQVIMNNGTIARVFFGGAYQDTSPLGDLINRGIYVYRVLPSGWLVDHETNEVVDAE